MDSDLARLIIGAESVIPEEELKEKLKEERPLRVKLGIDPTAPEIHLGFAVVLRKLRQFQDVGHIAVLIVGDFTARIGDPSGRSKTRVSLSEEQIRENMKGYTRQIFKILDKGKTELRYNSEWLSKLDPSDIIRLTSQITVARLLERDDFNERFKAENPIALHELLYPMFQAYDSVAVKADVELGGTDQRWNHLLGRDLQRSFGLDPQVVFLMPLLEGLDGVKKMSKSFNNFIGIEESSREQFGKVMSIPDKLILRYYELCLDYYDELLKNVKKRLKSGENPMDLKLELAEGIVRQYHSDRSAKRERAEFIRVFSREEAPRDIEEFFIKKDKEIWIVEVLDNAGLVKSRGEARRLIEQGALRIDGEKINDFSLNISIKNEVILRLGKKRFLKLVPQ
ncbi:MAG: tyrosine--tRNA ligase [Candidatus Stahlbacteria bacterium]|nr:MAG: tyrosine--tRNA ligase [Candidatus Stahlbacteria bacterium]